MFSLGWKPSLYIRLDACYPSKPRKKNGQTLKLDPRVFVPHFKYMRNSAKTFLMKKIMDHECLENGQSNIFIGNFTWKISEKWNLYKIISYMQVFWVAKFESICIFLIIILNYFSSQFSRKFESHLAYPCVYQKKIFFKQNILRNYSYICNQIKKSESD